MFSRLLGKALPPMDCEELAWYARQDAALQMRIRMLACFVADLHGTDRSRELPGACRGARRDRATFEEIVRCLVAPRSRAPQGSSGQRAAREAALASSAVAAVILCQRQAAQVFAVLGGPPSIEQLALLRRGLTVLPGEETARVQRMVARGEDHWIACPSADAASIPDVYLCATPCAGLHVAEAAPGAYGRNHAKTFLFRRTTVRRSLTHRDGGS